MLDRIQEILTARELSASQFADAIGVSRPVVSHLLSGRNKPSLEVVQKILAAFPDLAVNWLLSGNGAMLARPAVPAPAAPAPPPKPTPAAEASTKPEKPLMKPPIGPSVLVAPAPDPAGVVPPEALVSTAPESIPTRLAPVAAPAPPQLPDGATVAMALAEPGKAIRRIVLFYQDGTFADFRPEAGS